MSFFFLLRIGIILILVSRSFNIFSFVAFSSYKKTKSLLINLLILKFKFFSFKSTLLISPSVATPMTIPLSSTNTAPILFLSICSRTDSSFSFLFTKYLFVFIIIYVLFHFLVVLWNADINKYTII